MISYGSVWLIHGLLIGSSLANLVCLVLWLYLVGTMLCQVFCVNICLVEHWVYLVVCYLVLIILFAQYEKTLITKLLYSISDVFVLVYLVILFNMFILWFTLDIILLTLGVWSRPLVIYTPSIFNLSACLIMYLSACIVMSFVFCLCIGLHVMINLVLSGLILRKLIL